MDSSRDTMPAQLRGEFGSVSVSDTGAGISEELRERIFEPFFTTKPVDKGTGLGLSQVYGFVKQAQGAVTVMSQVKRGSRFTMFLPITNAVPAASSPYAVQNLATLDWTRVLLVEDNIDVAAVATDYLEQCRCSIVNAESAEAAIEILNARNDIDLVFSDVAMPGMSGLELARLVRHHYPEIRIILATGYSDKAARAVEEGFHIIEKPYSLDVMRESLMTAARPWRKLDPAGFRGGTRTCGSPTPIPQFEPQAHFFGGARNPVFPGALIPAPMGNVAGSDAFDPPIGS